jgi:hypothetical protein
MRILSGWLIASVLSGAMTSTGQPASGTVYAREASGLGVQTSGAISDDWKALNRLRGSAVVVRQAWGIEVSGRLTSMSADELVITMKHGPHAVSKGDVCDVLVRERNRSKLVGWIVGLTLAGLVAGILNAGINERAKNPAVFAAFGAGIGALIGASPDERTLFRRPGGDPSCHR